MSWEDWSDEELSFRLTVEVYGGNSSTATWCESECGEFIVQYNNLSGEEVRGEKVIDINSWAEMGPLIFENGISLLKVVDDEKWFASYGSEVCKGTFILCSKGVASDKNPLRAAAIVFLMTKGVTP